MATVAQLLAAVRTSPHGRGCPQVYVSCTSSVCERGLQHQSLQGGSGRSRSHAESVPGFRARCSSSGPLMVYVTTGGARSCGLGLHLALERGAEVLVQVEDDAQADDGVLLVVALEQLHAEREHLLHVRPQHLVVWQPVEHLEQHIADLLLRSLSKLRAALDHAIRPWVGGHGCAERRCSCGSSAGPCDSETRRRVTETQMKWAILSHF